MKNEKQKLKFSECLLLWGKKKTPAPPIFFTLRGQAREVILELDPDTLPVDSGV